MASEYGRYGYRRIAALLRAEGWSVNHKRAERF
jgi:putative transposase